MGKVLVVTMKAIQHRPEDEIITSDANKLVMVTQETSDELMKIGAVRKPTEEETAAYEAAVKKQKDAEEANQKALEEAQAAAAKTAPKVRAPRVPGVSGQGRPGVPGQTTGVVAGQEAGLDGSEGTESGRSTGDGSEIL